MTNDPIQDLWKSKPAKSAPISIDGIVRRNRRVATDVRNFSVQMSIAAAFNVVMWVTFATLFAGIARVGAVVALLGWAIAIGEVMIHRQGTLALAATMGDLPALSFYRKALDRERAFHSTAARWRRLVAFVTGPLIWIYGMTKGEANGLIVFAVVGGLWTGLYALGVYFGGRRARAIERQIADVDRELDVR
jgi:hypothetical protein